MLVIFPFLLRLKFGSRNHDPHVDDRRPVRSTVEKLRKPSFTPPYEQWNLYDKLQRVWTLGS